MHQVRCDQLAADALGDGGSYAGDDDPEFVGEASARTQDHRIIACCKADIPNFSSPRLGVYSVRVCLLADRADYLEEDDYEAASVCAIGQRMFRRARDYGLRASR